MNKVTLISVDLAKDVFQVAGFTDRMKEVFTRQVKRKDLHTFMVQQPTNRDSRCIKGNNHQESCCDSV